MLQQVLRDMYIDPELLAGLKEKEKQTLFCCMREEQVRRWRLWDQKESEAINNQPIRSKRTGKSVQWALDSTGEPRVDIIECKYEEADYSDSESSNHSNKQCEQKELRLSIEGARCLNLSSNDSVKKVPKYVDVTSNNKIPTSASVIINFNEKRGALQELSLNKVPKVARQVAEWEKRTTKEEFKLPAIGKTVDVESNNKIEHTNEVELQQERLWREQQKKAKEVEIRIRTIARLAREEHRRSLIENNDENFQSLLITENAWCKNINKPVNKEVLLEWFCTKEIPKMAVSDNNNSIARWFYGFISWQEAESLLDDEEIGTFLVRISEHILGYALSYKDVIDVKHYLIDVANGFYKIHGTDHISHNTLGELVSYYKNKPLTSNMDDVLKYPCCKERDLSYLFERSEC